MTDANDFLMSGGTASASFETPGTVIGGRITTPPEVQQQKDFDTGEPLTWSDGNPRQQIKVIVATDQRDPADPYDEGERALYVKGKMLQAVRSAVREAGARGLEVGGTLSVTYTGDGEPSQRGRKPPKLYSATYARPAAGGAANALLNGLSAAGQAAYEAAPAPAAAPPAPAAPAAPAAGQSPEAAAAIAALTPAQRAALGL